MIEPDTISYFRMVMALLFVIGLIALLGWGLRRYGGGGVARRIATGGRRLSIVENASVDARHRLVLVRRDDAEHLLLIGGSAPLVVERGIEGPVDEPEPGINASETKKTESAR